MICDGEKDERSNRDVLGDEGEGLRRGGRHGGNKGGLKQPIIGKSNQAEIFRDR